MSVREKIKALKIKKNRYFICVIENPDMLFNVAAVIRNVAAFGVEKIYIVGGYADMPKSSEGFRTNGKMNRSSVGASRYTFVKVFKTTQECVAHLRKNLYTIAVTSPHLKNVENVSLYETQFTHKRLSIWFGNEGRGISEEAVQNADLCIQIPMNGVVESLNLGTSTGIVLGYIAKQRQDFVESKMNKKRYIKERVPHPELVEG